MGTEVLLFWPSARLKKIGISPSKAKRDGLTEVRDIGFCCQDVLNVQRIKENSWALRRTTYLKANILSSDYIAYCILLQRERNIHC